QASRRCGAAPLNDPSSYDLWRPTSGHAAPPIAAGDRTGGGNSTTGPHRKRQPPLHASRACSAMPARALQCGHTVMGRCAPCAALESGGPCAHRNKKRRWNVLHVPQIQSRTLIERALELAVGFVRRLLQRVVIISSLIRIRQHPIRLVNEPNQALIGV